MNFFEELCKISPSARKNAVIYVFGTGFAWETARNKYKVYSGVNLEDFVFAFVDNNEQKQNTSFYGKPVIPPSEIERDNAVILIAAIGENDIDIGKQLAGMGFRKADNFFYYSVFESMLRKWMYTQLLQFKGAHLGKRCFIVGNGPSLTPEDLSLIKYEISFATNRIYIIFDKTPWRPTYYVAGDANIALIYEEINQHVKAIKFLNGPVVCNIPNFKAYNAYYFHIDHRMSIRPYPYKPFFSSDDIEIVGGGGSVTYICLQLAVYMGISEIILLGCDHSYPLSVRADGEYLHTDMKTRHFSLEYDDVKHVTPPAFAIDYATMEYQAAQDYAASHSIKIYNATRGGKLEIFERVDIDKIMTKKLG